MKKWLYSSGYRLGQVRQQLGLVAPLSAGEYGEVSQWLPAAALALFKTMSSADQRHSLRVCRGLLARGCRDRDMLAASLLHDVGKAEGRVPFWTRPAIVLGKKLAPGLLKRLVVYPINTDRPLFRVPTRWPSSFPGCGFPTMDGLEEATHSDDGKSPYRVSARRPSSSPGCGSPTLPRWRRALSYAWYHAEVGAELAAAAGLSQRALLYIRTHHQADGPAAELHEVDEVS